jgi:hypothetical protein
MSFKLRFGRSLPGNGAGGLGVITPLGHLRRGARNLRRHQQRAGAPRLFQISSPRCEFWSIATALRTEGGALADMNLHVGDQLASSLGQRVLVEWRDFFSTTEQHKQFFQTWGDSLVEHGPGLLGRAVLALLRGRGG